MVERLSERLEEFAIFHTEKSRYRIKQDGSVTSDYEDLMEIVNDLKSMEHDINIIADELLGTPNHSDWGFAYSSGKRLKEALTGIKPDLYFRTQSEEVSE